MQDAYRKVPPENRTQSAAPPGADSLHPTSSDYAQPESVIQFLRPESCDVQGRLISPLPCHGLCHMDSWQDLYQGCACSMARLSQMPWLDSGALQWTAWTAVCSDLGMKRHHAGLAIALSVELAQRSHSTWSPSLCHPSPQRHCKACMMQLNAVHSHSPDLHAPASH